MTRYTKFHKKFNNSARFFDKNKPVSNEQPGGRISKRSGDRQKFCFKCRKVDHFAKDCKEIVSDSEQTICYICGSTEHAIKECPEHGTVENTNASKFKLLCLQGKRTYCF